MEIADWLRRLGLEQYEPAFRANDIDGSVLSKLTADDLISLGVNSIGHRRKLLDSIATLQGISSSAAEPTRAEVRKESPRSSDAERRQLTVMFCDLVGSTALSASMDPEDLREIIAAYQKCAAETVRRFDGFVAKYLGDGILVYFGYPQAHEDDAERAVRAGLELIAAVGALKSQVPLKTRIGIGTGLVIVGDLIGSGEAQERGIVGETPNLAARLQGLAEPNSVIVAEATHELLGGLFEFKDLGPQDLKGFTARVRAWVALRPAVVESRFDALHGAGLTPLVGREEEIRDIASPLAKRNCPRGPSRAVGRRTGHWEVAAHSSAARADCSRTPHPLALFLLTAARGQRSLPDHRPIGTSRRLRVRR